MTFLDCWYKNDYSLDSKNANSGPFCVENNSEDESLFSGFHPLMHHRFIKNNKMLPQRPRPIHCIFLSTCGTKEKRWTAAQDIFSPKAQPYPKGEGLPITKLNTSHPGGNVFKRKKITGEFLALRSPDSGQQGSQVEPGHICGLLWYWKKHLILWTSTGAYLQTKPMGNPFRCEKCTNAYVKKWKNIILKNCNTTQWDKWYPFSFRLTLPQFNDSKIPENTKGMWPTP